MLARLLHARPHIYRWSFKLGIGGGILTTGLYYLWESFALQQDKIIELAAKYACRNYGYFIFLGYKIVTNLSCGDQTDHIWKESTHYGFAEQGPQDTLHALPWFIGAYVVGSALSSTLYYCFSQPPLQESDNPFETPYIPLEEGTLRLEKKLEESKTETTALDGMNDITDLSIMDNPYVICRNGHSVDRRTLPKINLCPCCKEPIRFHIPNVNLRKANEEFVERIESATSIQSDEKKSAPVNRYARLFSATETTEQSGETTEETLTPRYE
jgi:hypothetical protein